MDGPSITLGDLESEINSVTSGGGVSLPLVAVILVAVTCCCVLCVGGTIVLLRRRSGEKARESLAWSSCRQSSCDFDANGTFEGSTRLSARRASRAGLRTSKADVEGVLSASKSFGLGKVHLELRPKEPQPTAAATKGKKSPTRRTPLSRRGSSKGVMVRPVVGGPMARRSSLATSEGGSLRRISCNGSPSGGRASCASPREAGAPAAASSLFGVNGDSAGGPLAQRRRASLVGSPQPELKTFALDAAFFDARAQGEVLAGQPVDGTAPAPAPPPHVQAAERGVAAPQDASERWAMAGEVVALAAEREAALRAVTSPRTPSSNGSHAARGALDAQSPGARPMTSTALDGGFFSPRDRRSTSGSSVCSVCSPLRPVGEAGSRRQLQDGGRQGQLASTALDGSFFEEQAPAPPPAPAPMSKHSSAACKSPDGGQQGQLTSTALDGSFFGGGRSSIDSRERRTVDSRELRPSISSAHGSANSGLVFENSPKRFTKNRHDSCERRQSLVATQL